MNNLITPQEVVDIAFPANSNMKAENINEHIIHIAEVKYIRPAIGETLYKGLCNYEELVTKVKPALAYFVKCELIPSLSLSLSNGGLAVSNPQYMTAATDKQRTLLYESEMSKANTLLAEVLQYINDNRANYPEFTPQEKRGYRFAGIIL